MKKEVLRFDRVTQIKDNTICLDNFNIHIFQSEIVGIIGKNFHGLDEFINLVSQNIPINQGNIYFMENLVNQYQFSSMIYNNIAIIEKESKLVEDLSVIDNIFVLRKNPNQYIIDKKFLNNHLRDFLKELDFKIKGDRLISKLSFFEKCVVELIKAILNGAKLIIIKDLINIMSTNDLFYFHKIMNQYKLKGISFIYIFNHHEDSFNICDRVCLVENGRVIKIITKENFTEEVMYNHIFECFKINDLPINNHDVDNLISFKNINLKKIKNFNFTIEKGECIVLLDSYNMIINDFIELLTGKTTADSGEISINNKIIYTKKDFFKNVSIINENPIKTMLFENMTVSDNLSFLLYEKFYPKNFTHKIKKSILNEYKEIFGNDMNLKSIHELPQNILYKLIYYRIILYRPKLVVCFQPFAEADMYSRKTIIELINELLKQKIAVIIITVNISDSLFVANRLFVIEKGKMTNEYPRNSFIDFRGKNRTETMLNYNKNGK